MNKSRSPIRAIRLGLWSDNVGVLASLACAMHCAAMPFVIAYLPALGLSWLADEGFHQWMAIACFLLAALAFVPGWRRHGRWMPAALGTLGVTLLTGTAFGLAGPCCLNCQSDDSRTEAPTIACANDMCLYCQQETTPNVLSDEGLTNGDNIGQAGVAAEAILPWLTPLGGVLLVAGHLTNHRCSCGCCRKPDDHRQFQ